MSTAAEPVETVEEIGGTNLHYWIGGSTGPGNPSLVMIHGLRGTHHGLADIAANLPDRRTIVPDLPAFGDSGPLQGSPSAARHDVEGYARCVIALLRHLGADRRPVDLLGHSFGSLVAVHVVSLAPGLVRRLVLVNPISTPALRGPRALLSRLTSLYYWFGRVLPERAGRALLSNKAIVLGASRAMVRTRDPRLKRWVHDNHLRYFSRFHSPELLAEAFEASVSHTVADYVDAMVLPTLLVAGQNDDIAPLAGQQRLAGRLDDAELVVLPDVGHLVHYEKPAAAAREIRRFLDS